MMNDGYNLSITCQFPRSLTNIHGLIRQGSFPISEVELEPPIGILQPQNTVRVA